MKPQTGSAMVSVIIAAGILGMLSVVVINANANMLNSQTRVTQIQDLVSLRNLIEGNISCSETINSMDGDCKNSRKLVGILDDQNHPILSGAPSRYGKFTIFATCTSVSNRKGIQVFAIRPIRGEKVSIFSKKSKGFHRDPLTKRAQNIGHPRAKVLSDDLRLCQNELNRDSNNNNASSNTSTWSVLGMISPDKPFNFPMGKGVETTKIRFRAKGEQVAVNSTAMLAAKGENAMTKIHYYVQEVGGRLVVDQKLVHYIGGVQRSQTNRIFGGSTFKFKTEKNKQYDIWATKNCDASRGNKCERLREIDFTAWEMGKSH